jgi:hypothetical protein
MKTKKPLLFSPLIPFLGCTQNSLKEKQLSNRLIAVEDRLEILNLLTGSPIGSDVASESYWIKLITEYAPFDRGTKQDQGRDEILKIVDGTYRKEAIKAEITPMEMLLHNTLFGDSVVATGYLGYRYARFCSFLCETCGQKNFSGVYNRSIASGPVVTGANNRWLENYAPYG